MDKAIANIVFYKFWDPTREEPMQQACVFYEDGTVKNMLYEEGKELANQIARAEKIKTKAEFTSMINTKRVYALSGEEFERRFKEFLGKGTALVPVSSTLPAVVIPTTGVPAQQKKGNRPGTPPAGTNGTTIVPPVGGKTQTGSNNPGTTTPAGANNPGTTTPVGTNNGTPIIIPPVGTTPGATNGTEPGKNNGGAAPTTNPTGANNPGATNPAGANNPGTATPAGTNNGAPIIIPPVGTTPGATNGTDPGKNNGGTAPTTNPTGTNNPRTTALDPNKPRTSRKKKKKKNKKSKRKGKGLFSRLWVKVTAFILAAAMFFTGGFFVGRHTKSGQIINNNITQESQDDIQAQDQAYLNLLEKSTNADQKATMTHQGQSLDVFNRDFANAFIEAGKDVKASLTWDEMMALNLAYNTYNKDQIRIMFNGAEVDSKVMSDAYRNATLQLMGAYVISTRENPVNSSAFLTNPEQQAFVEKYNNLFLTMKETTGDEQVAAINAFYAELHKDFPITEKVREEGISHADARASVEPYMAAVTPMVMASEIMFQNVSGTDQTLSDKAIKYFNDIGLCNLVDEQFERAETITLTAETDDKQPLYTEFRNAKIVELIYEGNYPTDDAHRDLSQLAEFQRWVNGHFEIVDGVNTGVIITNSTTTPTETTVTSSRQEAVDKAGEQAVTDAENKVDADLASQNEAARKEAEAEAAKKSEAAKKEAEDDAADMQNQINDANNTINNGGTVNEDDFGDHDVDFNEEFEDGNGNLDDSVEDITTDGTGAKTEEDLPDPNQTGAIFDGQASTGTSTSTSTTDTVIVDNSGIYEYEEPYYGMTNEEIVNAYIASLEGQGAAETAKVYQKQ